MGLPKQVQQQLQEVEELERSMAPTTTVEEPEPDSKTEPNAQPTQTAEPPKAVEDKQTVQPTPTQSDQWEQRYKTLKGIFDAEMPKMQAQNKELAKQLAELKSEVELANKRSAKPEDPLVTEKDVQSFGEDLIDVQRRVAREVMRDLVAPLESKLQERDAKIAKLEALLGKTSGDVNTISFEQRLEQVVPGFARMNASDTKWVAWLDEVDEFTGQPRRAYAEFAYSKGDVDAVARVVDLYRKATKAAEPPQDTRVVELERQVAPRRSASAAAAAPAGERTYTEAEADRLWNKVRSLYSVGKNDEAAKIETELTQAYSTGRVRA